MSLTHKQIEAFKKINKLKVGALFMEQGTGKTRTALELIKHTECDFVLFITPFSTKNNLKSEIEKWGIEIDFEIVAYETISSSDSKYLELLKLENKYTRIFIVADESIFIKNENSKVFKRMLSLRDISEYRLILNGTPITKNEWDIYNQMEFLSPKIIDMDRNHFLNTFFKHIRFRKYGQKIKEFYKLSEVNIDYLHKLIEPYIFKCDFEFDKQIKYNNIKIEASEKTFEEYNDKKRLLIKSLEIGECSVEQFQNLAITCFNDENRHKEIAKHLKGQIIVFCSLLKEVDNISKYIDCYTITGNTPNEERRIILNKFKKDNKPLLMTFGTGSFGLNLQFCNRIAFSSIVFDFSKIEQSMARIKRIGQERDIEYTFFESNLGIYNMIYENIAKKKTLKEMIIDKIEKEFDFEKEI